MCCHCCISKDVGQWLQNALICSTFLWTFQVFCCNPQLQNNGKSQTVMPLFVTRYYHYTGNKKVYRTAVLEMHLQNVPEKPLVRIKLRWPYFYFSALNQDHIWHGCFWEVRDNRAEDSSPQMLWASYVCMNVDERRRGEGWSIVSLSAVILSHWPFRMLFISLGKTPSLGRGVYYFFLITQSVYRKQLI